jgi:type VI protein secretion system component Hcp
MKTLAAVMSVVLLTSAAEAAGPKPNSSTSISVPGLDCPTFGANSWSWGVSNPVIIGPGGPSSGKASVADLSVMRSADSCSPKLVGAVANGTLFKAAILTQYNGEGAVVATLTMENVAFSSLQLSSSDNQDAVVESVSISFGRFCLRDEATNASACYPAP